MLKKHFKFILMSTSLSPVILVFAITQLRYIKLPILDWICSIPVYKLILFVFICLVIPIILSVTCCRLTSGLSKEGTRFTLHINEFGRRGEGLLSFIFLYILPIIRMQSELSLMDCIIYVIVFILTAFIMTDIGSYNVNPIMRLCGYKIYPIKDRNNINLLLITKRTLRSHDPINTRRVCHDVFIEEDL